MLLSQMKILVTPKQGLKAQKRIKIVKILLRTFDPQYLRYLLTNLSFNYLQNCGIISSSYV